MQHSFRTQNDRKAQIKGIKAALIVHSIGLLLAMALTPSAQGIGTGTQIYQAVRPVDGEENQRPLLQNANVFLGENRQVLEDTTAPWRALGKVIVKEGSKWKGCTAALVGPRLVLTAARCVVKSEKLAIEEALFLSQLRGDKSFQEVKVINGWVGSFRPSALGQYHRDWAILLLESDLGQKVGWFGVGTLPVEKLVNLREDNPIFFAGYSGDVRGGKYPFWESQCRITGHVKGYKTLVGHSCSAAQGAIGSPLFYLTKNSDQNVEGRIVAIHTTNFALPIDPKTGKPVHFAQPIPFSDDVANLAVSSEEFIQKLRELRKRFD